MLRRSIRTHAQLLTIALCISLAGLAPGNGLVAQAQDPDGAAVRHRTRLLPPDGAANKEARGRAAAVFRNNQGRTLNRLTIKAGRLEPNAQYGVRVDGIDLGVHASNGDGLLKLVFRDPARDGVLPLPEEATPVVRLRDVEVFDASSGEVVLAGTLKGADGGGQQ